VSGKIKKEMGLRDSAEDKKQFGESRKTGAKVLEVCHLKRKCVREHTHVKQRISV
jgi:hypothetical protein